MKRKNISGRSLMEVLLYIAIITAMTLGTARMFIAQNAKAKQARFTQQIADIAEKTRSALYGRELSNAEALRVKLAGLGVDFEDPWGGQISIEPKGECFAIVASNLTLRDCVAAASSIKSDCTISANGIKTKYKTQAGDAALQGGDGLYAGTCLESGGNKVMFFYSKR
ncbi:MAG: hypothetical protein LBL52_00705 [Rickettsiales bacterium]|jgi:hypothetical protein|nr:hypothetical protein [Rickettsiales bacterium]